MEYKPSIYLDSEQLKKIGIDDLPEVGSEMVLHAKVKVASVSQSKSDDGESKSVSFELEEMELSKPSGKSAAQVMYGE